MRLVLFPRDAFEVHDTWDVAGLRGTGSNDIALDGARAPRVALGVADHAGAGQRRAASRLPGVRLLALSIASVTLGIAQAPSRTCRARRRQDADRVGAAARRARRHAGPRRARAGRARTPHRRSSRRRSPPPGRGARTASVCVGSAPRCAAPRRTRRRPRPRVTGDMYALGRRQRRLRVEPASAPPARRPRRHAAHARRPATWELTGRLALGPRDRRSPALTAQPPAPR